MICCGNLKIITVITTDEGRKKLMGINPDEPGK
jgi:hypothetical protein